MDPALSPPHRIDRTLLWALAGLALALAIFELTDIDLRVQDTLFDTARNAWLVDKSDPLWRMLFYTGPKILLIAFGLAVIATAFASKRIRDELGFADVHRRDLWVLGLTLAATPALVGALKDATNVFCPWELQRYGGAIPYVKVLERFPEGSRPSESGRCFPAGHASGGFALCALAGVARTRRGQWHGLTVATVVGGMMSVYQMAKGAHFLSHTVITALLAWVVFLAFRRGLGRHRTPGGTAAASDSP